MVERSFRGWEASGISAAEWVVLAFPWPSLRPLDFRANVPGRDSVLSVPSVGSVDAVPPEVSVPSVYSVLSVGSVPSEVSEFLA